MIVAITGGTGFVGSHVVDVLVEKGYTVRCVARKSSNLRWLQNKDVEIVDGSLQDEASLTKAFDGADYIIHVAGLIAARSLDEFMQGNKGGTENALRAAKATRSTLKRFVHISSMAAVGPADSRNAPLVESTPFHPITQYGISKQAAEESVQAMKAELPITIVRPPAVFGERDEAVLTFFQTVSKGIAPLIGFSEKWISLVHISDLARGIVEAMEAPAAEGQTYFISSEEIYNWQQVSATAAKVLNRRLIPVKIPHGLVMTIAGLSEFFGRFSSKPPVLNFEKGRDITQEYWICSVDKAKRDFGYKQMTSLEDGIQRTINWYKLHKWI